MSQKTSTDLPKCIEFKCKNLNHDADDQNSICSRHKDIEGFDQSQFSKTTVWIIGVGGLGGEIAEGLVRKGIGKVGFFDGDTVAPSNLNRQLFHEEDIGKNKATLLGYNLQKEGFMGSTIKCYPMFFQEYLENEEK